MDTLLKLAEFAIAQRVIGPYAPFNSLGKAKIALALFITLFTFIGLIFTLVGFYMWLMSEFPAPEAIMMFGATLIVLSILMVFLFAYANSIKEKKKQEVRDNVKAEITEVLLLIDQKIHENNPIKEHPTATVITSALAGYATGERAVKR